MTAELPFEEPINPSRVAFESIKKKLSKLQKKVFDCILASEWRGVTDDEIEMRTGLQGNTVRPRRLELITRGLVHDSGHRRKIRTGKFATVWTASRPEQFEAQGMEK